MQHWHWWRVSEAHSLSGIMASGTASISGTRCHTVTRRRPRPPAAGPVPGLAGPGIGARGSSGLEGRWKWAHFQPILQMGSRAAGPGLSLRLSH